MMKTWQLKLAYKTYSRMFWKKTRRTFSRAFDNEIWCQKNIKLNLLLMNPEWFRFTKHVTISDFVFCSAELLFLEQLAGTYLEEKKTFPNKARGFLGSNCKIRILIYNYHKIALHHHVRVSKFWRTWRTWVNIKKHISGATSVTERFF